MNYSNIFSKISYLILLIIRYSIYFILLIILYSIYFILLYPIYSILSIILIEVYKNSKMLSVDTFLNILEKEPWWWPFPELIIEILGEIKEKKVIEYLAKKLKDGDILIREKAAIALGKIGDKEALPTLIEALDDKSPEVRKSIIEAIGMLKDESAIETLILHSNKEENISILLSIAKSIEEIQSPLNEDFDSLLCKRCFIRAEKQYLIKYYGLIRCPSCKRFLSSDFLRVKKVIGIIDDLNYLYKVNSKECYVNLWNDKGKSAIYADINELKIVGGKNINYNLAVQKVIFTFTSRRRKTKNNIKNIPVILEKDPSLDDSTLQLLKNTFENIIRR